MNLITLLEFVDYPISSTTVGIDRRNIHAGGPGSGRHSEGYNIKIPSGLYQHYKGEFNPKKYNTFSDSSKLEDFDKAKQLFAVRVKDIDIASDKDIKNWDKEDQKGVKLYRESIRKGEALEPIEVYHKDGKIQIEDGDHRAAAARQEGEKHILAWVAHGGRKTTIKAGGPGSGRHKTGRKQKDAGRQSRGLASYNPATKAKLDKAIDNEKALAKAIPGAIHISDNKPFDVLHPGKRIGFEVKTKIDGKKHTITMHPASLGRKIKEKRTMKLKAIYTVIFDDRPKENKVYIAKGVGSFKIKLKDGTVNPKLREINLSGIKKVL